MRRAPPPVARPSHRNRPCSYLSLLLLAKESGFSEEKLSTFFSIVWLLHENTLEKDWDNAAAYAWLKTTVMQHSVKSEHGPPVFTAADVRIVTDFAIKGYIQHMLLYKFCFTKPQPEDTCPTPPSPAFPTSVACVCAAVTAASLTAARCISIIIFTAGALFLFLSMRRCLSSHSLSLRPPASDPPLPLPNRRQRSRLQLTHRDCMKLQRLMRSVIQPQHLIPFKTSSRRPCSRRWPLSAR